MNWSNGGSGAGKTQKLEPEKIITDMSASERTTEQDNIRYPKVGEDFAKYR